MSLHPDLLDFKEFYKAHAPFVRSFLFRLVGASLLDDAVQEAFVKAWKYRESFRGDSSVKTWLHKIATNAAIDLLRKTRHEVAFLEDTRVSEPENGDLTRDLEKIMLLIPMEFRIVLSSIVFNELSIKETAESLNIPEGTVKSRLSRGKDLLQNHLKIRGYDYGQ